MKIYKSILITGASSGIGAALASEYAKAGIFLAICGRNSERLSRVAAECSKKGACVAIKVLDVTHQNLSLIHISEPTRPERIAYAVVCL